MSWFCRRRVFSVSVALVVAASGVRAEPLETEIHHAIDKGIEFLLKAIENQQAEGEPRLGRIALETYALIVAGVSVDHPLIRKNLEALHKMQLTHTYTVSCYALLLDAAISQIQNDQQFLIGRAAADSSASGAFLGRLDKAVQAILHIKQPDRGAWNYGPGANRYDNSNTQFAVLALGAGANRKIFIPDGVWEEIAKHFIETQEKDGPEVQGRIERHPEEDRGDGKSTKIKIVEQEKEGDKNSGSSREDKPEKKESSKPRTEARKKTTVGSKPVPEIGEESIQVLARRWRYNQEHETIPWNMTCAGLSSLVLAADNLKGKVPANFLNKLNKGIRDGYGWVMQNWSPTGGGYYGIYSLEKVADLNEVKKFAGHDWYDEVARHLVAAQAANGGWAAGAGSPAQTRENTSFALLVLNRATTLLLDARRPISERIALTGAPKGIEKVAQDWVYIQSLNRELHIPSVLRMLRLRPNAKVLGFVSLILQDYPVEKKALLIPPLLKAHQETQIAGIQKALREQLERITGFAYPELQDYSKWLRRWQDVEEIGALIKKQEIPILLRYYQHTGKSLPLREKVIWALTRCQAREALEHLVADLAHTEASIRTAAYGALQSLPSSVPLPAFSAKAPEGERDKQLKAIQEWAGKLK